MRNMKTKDLQVLARERNRKIQKCPECGKDIHDADCPYSGKD
jgi:hypothetical protein